jgi:hypothetical protein
VTNPVERNPQVARFPDIAAGLEQNVVSDFERRRGKALQEELLRDPSLSPPPPAAGAPTAHERFEADPLAATAPHPDAEMQHRMRVAYEQQFGRGWRWLRRKLRLAEQFASLADSVGARFNAIFHSEAEQARFNTEVSVAMNQQATWLNGLREVVKEQNARLAFYEHHVPQVKRARAEYDRQRAERLLREADEAALVAAPVLPFDRNGVRPSDQPAPTTGSEGRAT